MLVRTYREHPHMRHGDHPFCQHLEFMLMPNASVVHGVQKRVHFPGELAAKRRKRADTSLSAAAVKAWIEHSWSSWQS